MYLALVYFPGFEHQGFHAFRNTYEPYASLLPEHFTFVFPLPPIIAQKDVEGHVREVLSHWSPFEVHFCHLMKTSDHWLFWTLEEGREQAIGLHDELYTGILCPYLREDLPYKPHIGLGLFSKEDYNMDDPLAKLTLDSSRYKEARKEFEEMNLDLWCSIDQLILLGVNADYTACTVLNKFDL